VPGNRAAVDKLFSDWVADQEARADIDPALLPGFAARMFGTDFVFSVTREDVRRCTVPLMLLPGEDDIHPAPISQEIAALAPDITVVSPWKGPALLEQTAGRVEAFLARHAARQPA
jgi:pimeloyl-ACP methyl ester carboxylesterase